jgi:hypothetical protein
LPNKNQIYHFSLFGNGFWYDYNDEFEPAKLEVGINPQKSQLHPSNQAYYSFKAKKLPFAYFMDLYLRAQDEALWTFSYTKVLVVA